MSLLASGYIRACVGACAVHAHACAQCMAIRVCAVRANVLASPTRACEYERERAHVCKLARTYVCVRPYARWPGRENMRARARAQMRAHMPACGVRARVRRSRRTCERACVRAACARSRYSSGRNFCCHQLKA
eukprot:5083653-Pleurochrysis_carterae.AAC.2